jgi:hypothetical protein
MIAFGNNNKSFISKLGKRVSCIFAVLRIILLYNLFVRFEVVTAVTMKNGAFWDVTPCGCFKT